MSEMSLRSGRANIEASNREIYEQLSKDSKNPGQSPFATMKDVFMMAACLGFNMGVRRPLKTRHQPFHYTVFSEQTDIPILKAIAICDTGKIDVISNFDEVVSIAEEYANAGIHELKAQVLEQHGEPLWNLVELVRSTGEEIGK